MHKQITHSMQGHMYWRLNSINAYIWYNANMLETASTRIRRAIKWQMSFHD